MSPGNKYSVNFTENNNLLMLYKLEIIKINKYWRTLHTASATYISHLPFKRPGQFARNRSRSLPQLIGSQVVSLVIPLLSELTLPSISIFDRIRSRVQYRVYGDVIQHLVVDLPEYNRILVLKTLANENDYILYIEFKIVQREFVRGLGRVVCVCYFFRQDD